MSYSTYPFHIVSTCKWAHNRYFYPLLHIYCGTSIDSFINIPSISILLYLTPAERICILRGFGIPLIERFYFFYRRICKNYYTANTGQNPTLSKFVLEGGNEYYNVTNIVQICCGNFVWEWVLIGSRIVRNGWMGYQRVGRNVGRKRNFPLLNFLL